MSADRHCTAHSLDAALSRVAAEAELAHNGRFRLLIATGGVFVLCPLEWGESAPTAGDEARMLSTATRDAIACHLAWVPFVDWFVVSDEPRTGCTALPCSLVAATAFGRDLLDHETVADLGALVSGGLLTPLWHEGIPARRERPAEPVLADARSGSGRP